MNGVHGYAHRFIKDFIVTHKKMKDVEDSVAYIGFPAASLEKYTPENATVEICKCGRFPLAKNKVTINLQKTNRHIIIMNVYASSVSAIIFLPERMT